MYEFHYDHIKKKYGDKAKLLFTDTDILTYEIESNDVYEDLWKDKHWFGNSDYPKESRYHYIENKKVIGKFKDEACGRPISEFVGLKSKMYSYIMENGKGGMTAKGIKKDTIRNNIKHTDYKRTLINNEQLHHKMKTIRSVNHQLGSYEIRCRSAASMTSTTSMIMEQAVMPMGTTKYNHRHQSFYQTYRPPYSWTIYRSLLLSKILASILLDKIYILFTFQNIGLHTSGQDLTYSSEVHDKGDPFGKLLE